MTKKASPPGSAINRKAFGVPASRKPTNGSNANEHASAIS
jgi:hypothetical protein